MARFLLTAVIGFAACQQGWADCADDEMDLCEDEAPSPMPTPMAKPMPTPMAVPMPHAHAHCDDPELDLCEDEKGEAPSPMPMPHAHAHCDEPELDLCEDEVDEAPSPMPMPSQSPTPAAPVQVTSFDTEMEMDDVTKFDTNKFKEAMAAASSVSADKIEIGNLEYKTKVTYSMPATVTEAAAKKAIARACNVPESRVEVMVSSRRLSEFRRLATTIDAIISTQTASEVSSIATKAADAAALKQAFADGGLTAEPTVAKEPKNSVIVNTMLKGEAGAAAPEAPPASTIQSQVSTKVGTKVVATTSNVVKGPQSTTPVPMPTPMATPAPTAPTPSPVSSPAAPSESADNTSGQAPALLLACAAARMVALLVDAV